MNNRLQPLNLNHLIKRPFNSNILHDAEVKPLFRDAWMRILDFLGFFFGAHCSYYGMAAFEKNI
jgi:hypothetical protein